MLESTIFLHQANPHLDKGRVVMVQNDGTMRELDLAPVAFPGPPASASVDSTMADSVAVRDGAPAVAPGGGTIGAPVGAPQAAHAATSAAVLGGGTLGAPVGAPVAAPRAAVPPGSVTLGAPAAALVSAPKAAPMTGPVATVAGAPMSFAAPPTLAMAVAGRGGLGAKVNSSTHPAEYAKLRRLVCESAQSGCFPNLRAGSLECLRCDDALDIHDVPVTN